MAITKDLNADQGATYVHHLNVKIGGEPLDFIAEGWSARMSIKRSHQTSASVLDLTVENGRLILHQGGVVGRLTISLGEDDTKSINIKSETEAFVYDLEIFNSDTVHRVWQGVFTLSKNVTTI